MQFDKAAKVRQYLRVPMCLPGRIRSLELSEKHQEMLIRNISFGGAFVESSQLYAPDTVVELSFSLPGSHPPIQIIGFVSWADVSKQPSGMGIQFVTISSQDQEHLQSFLRDAGWKIETATSS